MGPGDLEKALCGLEIPKHPDLLVGLDTFDDAGVYKLRDDLAIIQSLDFFTPIVDDPYSFGQVAAANALSDIYAMGGTPLTAMNIICFPVDTMDISILQEILKGGQDKINEAGANLVGGHSISDIELKYGLSVTGTIHPDNILTNKGARVGDKLVLTKPIGTGIVNTAIKGNLADDKLIRDVTKVMSTLNKNAAELLNPFDVSACTDVTGFGLLGHAFEMIDDGKVGLKIDPDRVPLIDKTLEFAQMGIVPGGARRNRTFRNHDLLGVDRTEPAFMDILFDPQTSGGLLVAVKSQQAEDLVGMLNEKGLQSRSIGKFIEEPKGKIILAS